MKKITDLKVVGTSWHTSHQHRIAPLFKQYDMIINPFRRFWAVSQRPQPDNVKYVTHYEKGKYDFAILHVDQQSIYAPEDGTRIAKGRIYNELNSIIQDIPKVVINHMTPFHDQFDSDYVIDKIKEMIGDNIMVVNSHEAGKQWGWGNPIIHGYNKDDWWDLPKEPRVAVVLSTGGMEKAYRRIFLEATLRILEQKKIPVTWVGRDVKFNSWDEYRDFLGRSLIFFHPAYQSPMAGARTEAMLSGCCIVSTRYQDADTFIEHGVNGFLTSKGRIEDPRIMDNPEYTANMIEELYKNPDVARKVGQRGKETAHKIFTFERLKAQWENLLVDNGIL